jgi:hypothetical protein
MKFVLLSLFALVSLHAEAQPMPSFKLGGIKAPAGAVMPEKPKNVEDEIIYIANGTTLYAKDDLGVPAYTSKISVGKYCFFEMRSTSEDQVIAVGTPLQITDVKRKSRWKEFKLADGSHGPMGIETKYTISTSGLDGVKKIVCYTSEFKIDHFIAEMSPYFSVAAPQPKVMK